MYNEMNCELTHDYVGEDQESYEERHDTMTAGLIVLGVGLLVLTGILALLMAFSLLAGLVDLCLIMTGFWA